jgi:uncharacterized coiled-coil DUF342 family protein
MSRLKQYLAEKRNAELAEQRQKEKEEAKRRKEAAAAERAEAEKLSELATADVNDLIEQMKTSKAEFEKIHDKADQLKNEYLQTVEQVSRVAKNHEKLISQARELSKKIIGDKPAMIRIDNCFEHYGHSTDAFICTEHTRRAYKGQNWQGIDIHE